MKARLTLLLAGLVASAAPHAGTIDIPAAFDRLDTASDQEILVERDQALELNDVISRRSEFRAALRTHFPPAHAPVWSHFSIRNPHDSDRVVVLANPFPPLERIDLHVVRTNGARSHFELGRQRPPHPQALRQAENSIPIRVDSGEQFDVYTRHASRRAMEINTQVIDAYHYVGYTAGQSAAWALFAGLALAMILYNLVTGVSLRQPVFLWYALHGLAIFGFHMARYGSVALPEIHIAKAVPSEVMRILIVFGLFAMTMFAAQLFELRERAPGFARLVYAFAAVNGVLLTLALLALIVPGIYPYPNVTASFALTLMTLLAGLALYAIYNRWPGSVYYLLGTGSFAGLSIWHNAHMLGHIPYTQFAAFSGAIGFTIELLLLALALGKRIRRVEHQRRSNERLLLEQSRFLSLGRMLASIVHQLKQPVVHLGTALMRSEALLDQPSAKRDRELPGVLGEMRSTVDFMDQTINELYRFHAPHTEPRTFRPAAQIEHVLGILAPATSLHRVTIHRRLDNTLYARSHPNAFAHVVMILVENAIQIMDERGIENPILEIDLAPAEDGEALQLTVTDNGGGIPKQQLSGLFSYDASDQDPGGLGIGLALAKQLTEARLAGNIQVENLVHGARFIVTMPTVAAEPMIQRNPREAPGL